MVEVDTEHLGHAELGVLSEKRADRHHRVAGLEAPGARLDQEGIEDEVVMPIDEEHLGGAAPQSLLERLGAVGPSVPAAQDDDPGRSAIGHGYSLRVAPNRRTVVRSTAM